MTKTPGSISLLVGSALLVAAVAPAQAQEEPSASGLEEIVVTARKREESIQDAPLSIQAFSAAQIEERGVENVTEIAKYTPGLTYYASTSRASGNFSIRGMTQINPVGDNRRDLVTTFIDGVPYLGTPVGLGSEDLARIEVIKGPQSALFGRATFGGAISLITATPGDTFKGRVGATTSACRARSKGRSSRASSRRACCSTAATSMGSTATRSAAGSALRIAATAP